MNWDQITGDWKQFNGKVKEKWGMLTDDDVATIAGKRDQPAGLLQERYGYATDQAEKELDEFSKCSEEVISRKKPESFVTGAIVDSWIESARSEEVGAFLVLQVAPIGHPKDLVVVEAKVSLVSDRLWLEDLSENLCQGSPVVVLGSRTLNGFFAATGLKLLR